MFVKYSGGVARVITFAFGSPFAGATPPCLRAAFAISGVDAPKTGSTYTIAPNAALNPISVVESATCSISIPTYNSWSLAAPATVTFTKVDGANVEISFTLKMGPKHGVMAAGTFTLSGTIKSPCYVPM